MLDIALEKKLDKSIIEYNTEIKNYSTFGIGGKVLAVIKPRNQKELIDSVKVCEKLKLKFQVIGNGSNILFKTKPTKRVFITTKFMLPDYKIKGDKIIVSAGTLFADFTSFLIEHGFSGLEELCGIPATIGGMVMMNAGAFGKQIFDYIESIDVLDFGKVKKLNKSEILCGHHYTNLLKTNKIVLSVTFKLERLAQSVVKSKCREISLQRNEKQPKGKSLGSVFRMTKNNIPAGLIIDRANLKGLKINDAIVSEKHANFIINLNKATDVDVKKLISLIKQKVKEKFNINLKREIEYIGERDGFYRWLSHTYKIF